MAIQLNKMGKPVEYPEGKDKAVTRFSMLIIKNAPEYDAFSAYKMADKLDLDKDEIRQCKSLHGQIRYNLIQSGFCIQYGSSQLKLTKEGRDYKNNIEPEIKAWYKKTDWYKITSIVISILALVLGYMSLQLKQSQFETEQKLNQAQESLSLLKEELTRTQDSLLLLKSQLNRKESKGTEKNK